MAEEQEEQDPSIEEILDSIRQIISDDDDDGMEEAADDVPVEPESAPAPEPEEPEDFIELTEKLEEEPVARPKPEPVAEPEPEPEEPEPEPIEVDMQEAEPMDNPMPRARKQAADDFDSVLTNTAETAAYEGFAEIAKKTAIEHNGVTVEEIVRTELRPLLRDWLDKHLPSIIERLVQDELERVAKRALDD